MGLKPLEYLDCFLDSPAFRENLLSYEKELDSNSSMVKNLTKECRRLIQATEGELFFVCRSGEEWRANNNLSLSSETLQLQKC